MVYESTRFSKLKQNQQAIYPEQPPEINAKTEHQGSANRANKMKEYCDKDAIRSQSNVDHNKNPLNNFNSRQNMK